MKYIETRFQKPAKVLQVFRQVHRYGKEEKSFADRKERLQWKAVTSFNGYVKDEALHLPVSIQAEKGFGNCDLITIEDEADLTPQHDWKMIREEFEEGNNHCFDLQHRRNYEVFWFQGNHPLQLLLKYDWAYIGDPKRDSFTLAPLEKGRPVEVRINGKQDTTRGRHFKEQSFIFHLLGEFDRCYLLNEHSAPVVKKIPEQRKLVDLLKPLW